MSVGDMPLQLLGKVSHFLGMFRRWLLRAGSFIRAAITLTWRLATNLRSLVILALLASVALFSQLLDYQEKVLNRNRGLLTDQALSELQSSNYETAAKLAFASMPRRNLFGMTHEASSLSKDILTSTILRQIYYYNLQSISKYEVNKNKDWISIEDVELKNGLKVITGVEGFQATPEERENEEFTPFILRSSSLGDQPKYFRPSPIFKPESTVNVTNSLWFQQKSLKHCPGFDLNSNAGFGDAQFFPGKLNHIIYYFEREGRGYLGVCAVDAQGEAIKKADNSGQAEVFKQEIHLDFIRPGESLKIIHIPETSVVALSGWSGSMFLDTKTSQCALANRHQDSSPTISTQPTRPPALVGGPNDVMTWVSPGIPAVAIHMRADNRDRIQIFYVSDARREAKDGQAVKIGFGVFDPFVTEPNDADPEKERSRLPEKIEAGAGAIGLIQNGGAQDLLFTVLDRNGDAHLSHLTFDENSTLDWSECGSTLMLNPPNGDAANVLRNQTKQSSERPAKRIAFVKKWDRLVFGDFIGDVISRKFELMSVATDAEVVRAPSRPTSQSNSEIAEGDNTGFGVTQEIKLMENESFSIQSRGVEGVEKLAIGPTGNLAVLDTGGNLEIWRRPRSSFSREVRLPASRLGEDGARPSDIGFFKNGTIIITSDDGNLFTWDKRLSNRHRLLDGSDFESISRQNDEMSFTGTSFSALEYDDKGRLFASLSHGFLLRITPRDDAIEHGVLSAWFERGSKPDATIFDFEGASDAGDDRGNAVLGAVSRLPGQNGVIVGDSKGRIYIIGDPPADKNGVDNCAKFLEMPATPIGSSTERMNRSSGGVGSVFNSVIERLRKGEGDGSLAACEIVLDFDIGGVLGVELPEQTILLNTSKFRFEESGRTSDIRDDPRRGERKNRTLSFSPNGRTREVDIKLGKINPLVKPLPNSSLSVLADDREHKMLIASVAGASAQEPENGLLKISYDLAASNDDAQGASTQATVYSIDETMEDGWVAFATQTSGVALWRTDALVPESSVGEMTPDIINPLPSEGAALSLVFDHSGGYGLRLAVGANDGSVYIYRFSQETKKWEHKLTGKTESAIISLSFLQNGKFLLARSRGGQVSLFSADPESAEELRALAPEGEAGRTDGEILSMFEVYRFDPDQTETSGWADWRFAVHPNELEFSLINKRDELMRFPIPDVTGDGRQLAKAYCLFMPYRYRELSEDEEEKYHIIPPAPLSMSGVFITLIKNIREWSAKNIGSDDEQKKRLGLDDLQSSQDSRDLCAERGLPSYSFDAYAPDPRPYKAFKDFLSKGFQFIRDTTGDKAAQFSAWWSSNFGEESTPAAES